MATSAKLKTSKDTIRKMRSQTTGWENTFANHISDKGLMHAELLEFNHKEVSNPSKKLN